MKLSEIIRYLVVLVVASAGLLGCGTGAPIPPPAAPLSQPADLCTSPPPHSACLSPRQVALWLGRGSLEIVGVGETSGSSGAKIMTLRLKRPHETFVLRAKWRTLGGSLFNDARKEIAAYAVQRLMLLPHEYVVPPTVGHCFDLRTYRKHVDSDASPNIEGLKCVFGSLSYWLEHVETPKPFSEARFRENPEYRAAIADVNLFTYLIQHGDTHNSNFLVSRQPKARTLRIYSPDNAIAFSPVWRNPLDYFRDNWYELRVPALRQAVVTRLRKLTPKDFSALRVIEQYRIEGARLVPVAPGKPIDDDDEGLRRDGATLQLGLTDGEVERLRERVRSVLQRVDQGEIGLFGVSGP